MNEDTTAGLVPAQQQPIIGRVRAGEVEGGGGGERGKRHSSPAQQLLHLEYAMNYINEVWLAQI